MLEFTRLLCLTLFLVSPLLLSLFFLCSIQAVLRWGSKRVVWSRPRCPSLCTAWLRWRPLSPTPQPKLTTSASNWLPHPQVSHRPVQRTTVTPATSLSIAAALLSARPPLKSALLTFVAATRNSNSSPKPTLWLRLRPWASASRWWLLTFALM